LAIESITQPEGDSLVGFDHLLAKKRHHIRQQESFWLLSTLATDRFVLRSGLRHAKRIMGIFGISYNKENDGILPTQQMHKGRAADVLGLIDWYAPDSGQYDGGR